MHLSPGLSGKNAVRVDLAERDQEDLAAPGDTLVLDPTRSGAIASVRLR